VGVNPFNSEDDNSQTFAPTTSDKARYVNKRADTVGQPQSAEICVSNMPSLKAKKLRKLPEKKCS
jgi:hypothetical protein